MRKIDLWTFILYIYPFRSSGSREFHMLGHDLIARGTWTGTFQGQRRFLLPLSYTLCRHLTTEYPSSWRTQVSLCFIMVSVH